MPNFYSISGEVAGASASLAGLILVFLGAIFVGFDSYDTTAKPHIVDQYRGRARSALTGFLLSLGALLCALGGKLFMNQFWSGAAVMLLFIAVLWIASVAWSGFEEIKV